MSKDLGANHAGEDAGDPKRAKGASGRAARAAGRGHDDVPEEQEHPQVGICLRLLRPAEVADIGSSGICGEDCRAA